MKIPSFSTQILEVVHFQPGKLGLHLILFHLEVVDNTLVGN